jgi:hypothetical protein
MQRSFTVTSNSSYLISEDKHNIFLSHSPYLDIFFLYGHPLN